MKQEPRWDQLLRKRDNLSCHNPFKTALFDQVRKEQFHDAVRESILDHRPEPQLTKS
jgi:hypothetical protein